MANTLLNIAMITNEALMVLENNLTFTKRVNRQYDDQFGRTEAQIGTTLNIRKPTRYTRTMGPTLQVQSSTETYVPLALNNWYQQSVSFTTEEMTLNIAEFSDRFLKPEIAQLANNVDYDGLQQYINVANAVGTPGSTPTTLNTYLLAGVQLDNNATPMDGERSVVINPLMQASLVNALTNLFNPTGTISEQYRKGAMGEAIGFDFNMDQNVGVQTYGTYGATSGSAGTVAMSATAGQTGSSIATTGWNSLDFLNVGDTFTIAGVFTVNPQNYQTTSQLQTFTVTALSTANSGGAGASTMTVSIFPAITPLNIVNGFNNNAFANVNAAPAGSAKITVLGASGTASPQGLAFHKDAFTFACVDLFVPGGVDMAKRVSSKKLNLSIRAVRAYDINNDRLPMRLDLLGGWATIRPEIACRVQG